MPQLATSTSSLLRFVVCVLLVQHGLVYVTAVILSAGATWKRFFFFHLCPQLLVRACFQGPIYTFHGIVEWPCIATCLCTGWRWPSNKQKRKFRDWCDVFIPCWFCALSLLLSFILGQFFFLVPSENSLGLQRDKFCGSSFLCVMHCLHNLCSYTLFHHGIYYFYLSEEMRCAFW